MIGKRLPCQILSYGQGAFPEDQDGEAGNKGAFKLLSYLLILEQSVYWSGPRHKVNLH